MENALKFVKGGAGGALIAAGFFFAAPKSYVLWLLGTVLLLSVTRLCAAGSTCEKK